MVFIKEKSNGKGLKKLQCCLVGTLNWFHDPFEIREADVCRELAITFGF